MVEMKSFTLFTTALVSQKSSRNLPTCTDGLTRLWYDMPTCQTQHAEPRPPTYTHRITYSPSRQLPLPPVNRAEVKITLRGRSESPPLFREKQFDQITNRHQENLQRRHSFREISCANQYPPVNQQLTISQSADVRPNYLPIGETVACESQKPVAAFGSRNLEIVINAKSRLPPVYPGSAFPRTNTNSGLNQQRSKSRPVSGVFSSTFLINKPGHACITRSKSFKTLRISDSPIITCSDHPLVRHLSCETVLRVRTCVNYVPTLSHSTEVLNTCESPRLHSVASVESVFQKPQTKPPPAPTRPQLFANAQLPETIVMLNSIIKSGHRADTQNSQEISVMTGGGENTIEANSNVAPKPISDLSAFYPATKRMGPTGRHYARVQLPSTRAASRTHDHVMTDSLKLYEEQIFSHQILTGQRPMSWCIDVVCSEAEDDNSSSGSASVTNSSSTMSSACSSSSSNASHPVQVGHPRLGDVNRAARMRGGAAIFGRSMDLPGKSPLQQSRNISPIIRLSDNGSPSPHYPIALSSPPLPPGATRNRVASQSRSRQHSTTTTKTNNNHSVDIECDPPTPSADEANKDLLGGSTSSNTSFIGSFNSSLATVRPARPDTPPPAKVDLHSESSYSETVSLPDPVGDGTQLTSPTVKTATLSGVMAPPEMFFIPGDEKFKSVSMNSSLENTFSLVPPPGPWNSNGQGPMQSLGGGGKLFVCPYCRALPTHCRCEARQCVTGGGSSSYKTAASNGEDSKSSKTSVSTDDDYDDETSEESTYAFSTLDSDFIAWMRLSVKDVTVSHPCFTSHKSDSLANLTKQDLVKAINIFNTNMIGLQMTLVEDSNKLIGTIRVYINLIKPVKMSLRQTLKHMPLSSATTDQSAGPGVSSANSAQIPDRLISFFLPRGGSRVMQLAGSTTAQEVIQCLLDRFHIQESASKFALYEHTLESNTIFSRKLSPSDRPLSMILHWVRLAITSGENFANAIRRKRIVLQENDNWEVEWTDFTPAELTNFLRILEKEESEYRNAIYFQYGLVRQQIEQRMASLSAHDRLLANSNRARHSVATCPDGLFDADNHHRQDSGNISPPAASL